MRGQQVIAMWRLIANGSVLLKVLLAMALVCILLKLSLYEQRDKVMAMVGVWGLIMMMFVNTILVLNTAKFMEIKRVHLVPRFRQTLVFTLIGWFLATAIYVYIMVLLSGSPNKSIPYYLFSNVLIIVLALLVSLAIAVSFDRRILELVLFVFFVFYSQLVRLGFLGEINNVIWAESFLYVAGALSIIALVFLMSWSSSTANKPKIFTGLINRVFSTTANVTFTKQACDVITLQIFRRYSRPYFALFYWCIAAVFVFYFSARIEEGASFQQAGGAIMLLLCLICFSQNNSIYYLRNLWLKGAGDRAALFNIWEIKKVQELLVINAFLALATTVIFFWHSSGSELIVLTILTILVVSFFASYLVAFLMTHNFSFLTAQLGVVVLCVVLILSLFIFPNEIDVDTLSYAAGTIVILTLILRTQLKKQVSRLDWLLMPKPSIIGK